jgi:uridylate kinase
VRLPRVGYLEVLGKGLKVMDATAISLCMDHQMPIVVFDLTVPGNIRRVIAGEPVGSIIGGDAHVR